MTIRTIDFDEEKTLSNEDKYGYLSIRGKETTKTVNDRRLSLLKFET